MAGVTLRVEKTTIADYIRKNEDARMQKYGLLKYLQKKGRVVTNVNGTGRNWKVLYKRNTPVGMSDGEVMSFERIRRHEQAAINMRSQSMNEAISKAERLQNKGKTAIANLWGDLTDQMMDDFLCDLDTQLYLDGGEAGREDKLEGFQTVVNKAETSSDQYPKPSSSHEYAGLHTQGGYYGGTASTYPDGVIDPEYYFWTPFQTKYDHTSFGGSSWEDNCIEALRMHTTYVESSRGDDGRPDNFWLPPKLHAQFRNAQDEKERIVVERGQDSEAVKLGFKAVNFEGYDLIMDFHVPAAKIFGFKSSDVEIDSWQSGLLEPGSDFEITDRTHRLALDFFGNTRFIQVRSLNYLGAF
jgi:hypothetical protein